MLWKGFEEIKARFVGEKVGDSESESEGRSEKEGRSEREGVREGV